MAQILPYIAIYPGDWLQSELDGLPLEIQGLWLRMMFVMSRAEKYGELGFENEPFSDEFIAKKCRISTKKYKKFAEILKKNGVLKTNEHGIIYSGRMVKKRIELEQNRARQKDFYDRNHGKNDEEKPVENEKPNGDLTGHARARHISVSSQVNKKEEKSLSRPKAEPKTKPEDPRRHHPAIVAVNEVVGLYPPKEIWDEIIDSLGMDIDTGKLKLCFTKWRARGYNKTNYAGFISWYHDGVPAPHSNGNTRTNHIDARERSAQRGHSQRVGFREMAAEAERKIAAERSGARALLGEGGHDPDQNVEPSEP